MKPFKTHNQQLTLLRSRNMVISDGSKAKRILESEGYYNVINGYKDLFLVKNGIGIPVNPELYIQNTKFEEVHALYVFDRELRNTLLKYLLIFEKDIKSKISYRFPEKFSSANAYLDIRSFTNNPDQLKQIVELISIITSTISKHAKRKDSPIKHYLDNHQEVPLWVLSNQLTIGNINNFYECIDDGLKDLIAKDYSTSYRRNYNLSAHIPKETLMDVLKTVNMFRNVCAHEERLYCFKLNRRARSNHISNLLNIPTSLLVGNLFTVVAQLKLVLTKKNFNELLRSIKELFLKFEGKFSTITFDDIKLVMGFQPNWESLF
ncbi:Abi family protein [Lysinibacillus sp. G4S2]|uniref:Abi family protein n=1 Tax=Lysinibacillus sp. G4S2 TaxID=3055859 RepID=UPI0025A03724|nr:Abi family protein [Lysinibacillus sp. G4S2]MDM5250081.1 Abi family protein [Lysinibacillus sp. G4S2]